MFQIREEIQGLSDSMENPNKGELKGPDGSPAPFEKGDSMENPNKGELKVEGLLECAWKFEVLRFNGKSQ
jgi:hypothetical protein